MNSSHSKILIIILIIIINVNNACTKFQFRIVESVVMHSTLVAADNYFKILIIEIIYIEAEINCSFCGNCELSTLYQ